VNLNLVIAGIVIIGLALECLSLSLRVRRMTAALVHWESVFAEQNAQIERLRERLGFDPARTGRERP
jgi:hypothetical protein